MRWVLFSTLLVVTLATGCNRRPDPRDNPNYVDTSDPTSVAGTMKPIPDANGSSPESVKLGP